MHAEVSSSLVNRKCKYLAAGNTFTLMTALAVVCFFFCWRGCRKLHFCVAERSSHIRPKIDKLACQAKDTDIFKKNTSTLRPKKEREPLWLSFLFCLMLGAAKPWELAHINRIDQKVSVSILPRSSASISLHLAIFAGLSASSGRRRARRSIRV